MDSADSFASFLAARRLRVTSERLAIAGGVAATGGHFDVDSLLADLRRRRVAVSRATLYRTLSHLLQAGLVRRVRGPDGSPRYESMAGRRPHHHMVCLGCGAILEFTDGRLETLQRHACRRRGFTMTDHSLRIEGFCRRCAAARER